MACASYDIFPFSVLNIQKGRHVTMSGFDATFSMLPAVAAAAEIAIIYAQSQWQMREKVRYCAMLYFNGFCIKLSSEPKMWTLILRKSTKIHTSTIQYNVLYM